MSTDTTENIKIDEKIEKKIKHPKKYNVVMLNDDVTPMEWVMNILKYGDVPTTNGMLAQKN